MILFFIIQKNNNASRLTMGTNQTEMNFLMKIENMLDRKINKYLQM
jgi:hypothetical protein